MKINDLIKNDRVFLLLAFMCGVVALISWSFGDTSFSNPFDWIAEALNDFFGSGG